MAAKIKGNNLVTWGAGVVTGNWGKIQTASRKHGGEKVELKDENGETFCVIYFDDKDGCEFKAIFQSNIVLPTRGDLISIGGVVNALVDDFDVDWENTNAKMLTLRATKYANI
jgi:hypothetical protein